MYKKDHILIVTAGKNEGESVKVLEAKQLKTKVKFLDSDTEPRWIINTKLTPFLSDIFSI